MERLLIYCGVQAAGELTVTEEPLYLRFDAACPLREEGLWRLWAVGEGGEAALGVLEPVEGSLRLSRRLSRSSLGGLGKLLRGELRQGEATQTAQWLPLSAPETFFQGPFRGELRQVQGALWRQEGALRLLALPFDTRRPFLLTGLFCFARVRMIGATPYAVFAFDRQERPVMR